ncbi:TIGR02186 family protein [Cognatishimia activa]|uniref:Putative transmembrane protein (Alph_Pro_TM) n=1 Tax=Cognatishimia activa TaxID=1715691 RepID=A0A0P1J8Y4_9RHOB|nr:TIGR02186 family protein [Cognatishimia activa]MEE2944291.1 TIGR02186 family protein [Pseudomonadota bacterium]CUJ02489.1 Putative transmembrane protein (Alph_Pro_TM) [Cognatishimia activa]CUK26139.1 Putative transmembrane protein (Alph_Pro_TM) [Cognatishimia activa]
MRRLLISLALLIAPLTATANEEVVLGLSQNRVAITANFDGSEILVFGAVKRETQIPDGDPLEVVIAISGPKEKITVRRKEKRFGIWVNTESVTIDGAPSFYTVATSGPLRDVLTAQEDKLSRVSIENAIDVISAHFQSDHPIDFAQAVSRIRTDNGLYSVQEGAIEVAEQTLFRTSVAMPANLTEGDYSARVFLTRSGKIVSEHETTIDVRKVGLERFLFNLSRQQPLIYGLLSLAIAIVAGWGASAFFRVIRQVR